MSLGVLRLAILGPAVGPWADLGSLGFWILDVGLGPPAVGRAIEGPWADLGPLGFLILGACLGAP